MEQDAPETRSTPVTIRGQRERAIGHASLSLFVPGLGQAAQRRYMDAALQFGTVAVYLVGVFSLGGGRAFVLALLWNAWSVVDAFRHEVE